MKRWEQQLRQGFTIVELIIVVFIIVLLTLIVFLGYEAVTDSANDSAVKSDLQKIDGGMKQYALKTEGIFPSTVAQLEEVGLKLSDGVYYTDDRSNIYFCANPMRTEYAVVSKSKSGKRFVQKSEQGISEYTGAVVWDATSTNGWDTCADVDSSYIYLGISAMNAGNWSNWANAVADPGSVTNLVVNPNAASLTTYFGYGAAGTNALNSSGGFSGDTFIRRSFTGAGTGGLYLGNNLGTRILITTGETYTSSAYLRASSPHTIVACIEWYDGSSSMVSFNCGTAVSISTEWRRIYVTAVAPASATNASLTFYSSTAWANGQYQDLDAVSLTQGTTLYNYADGDVPGWSWSGSANASPSTGPTP